MKKLLLSLTFFLALSVNAFAAELLVNAKGDYRDSLTTADVAKMTAGQLRAYQARSKKGDIVVVRPDGWKWGKSECLPNFIVVKVPDMTEAEAKVLEQPLTQPIIRHGRERQQRIRFRKNAVSQDIVSTAISNKTSTIAFNKKTLPTIISVKTGDVSEVTPPKAITISYYLKPYLESVKNFFIGNAYATPSQLKKIIKPSGQGGDYTSLAACLYDNEQDLVDNDLYFDVEIDGTWTSSDTTNIDLSQGDYNTDSIHYINIYTTPQARHKGVFTTSAYYRTGHLYCGLGDDDYIYKGDLVKIDGLQFYEDEDTNHGWWDFETNGVEFSHCVHYAVFLSSEHHQATNGGYIESSPVKLWNNIMSLKSNNYISDFKTVFLDIESYDGETNEDLYISVYNNTIYSDSPEVGLASQLYYLDNELSEYNTYLYLKNNISIKNLSNSAKCYYFDSADTSIKDTSNNISNDATSPDISFRNKTVTFKDSSNFDFHLNPSDTSALGQGIDLHLDSALAFSDDIDGEIRTAPWDIGADQHTSTTEISQPQIPSFAQGFN